MKTRPSSSPQIELLESRIAPASLLHYTDVDGDKVTISSSLGHLSLADLAFIGGGSSGQLQSLTLDPTFAHANISITAVKAAGGDGLVNVGVISAFDVPLGVVTVQGDLAQINAGVNGTTGVAALNVRSMGRYGLATGSGNAYTQIAGNLGSLHVTGDLSYELVSLTSGNLGSVFIGGSLVGTTAHSGLIETMGSVGNVFIGGSIVGGTTTQCGAILAGTNIGNVTVAGSIQGGSDTFTGAITSGGSIGAVTIGHDLVGGGARESGLITAAANIASVRLGGSLVGGAGSETDFTLAGEGQIVAHERIGPVSIVGSLLGAAGFGSAEIRAHDLTSAFIGGSILGGAGPGSGHLATAGAMGPVLIAHDLAGSGDPGGSFSGFLESAGGITSVRIGGSVLGGAAVVTGVIEGAGVVGPVVIGHDVRGSSGEFSGIISAGSLTSLSIGGSLLGGISALANDNSGGVSISNSLGAVHIGGSLIGATVPSGSTTGLSGSGFIDAQTIASVYLGDSLISGQNLGSSTMVHDGSINASASLGSVVIRGSILGNGTNPAIISADGQITPSAHRDLAIASLSVGGRVERAEILAGYRPDLTPNNGNASIGVVTVGGDWIASSLIAGAKGTGGSNFGSSGDTGIAKPNDTLKASIAGISIAGVVIGTPDEISTTDNFGFEAEVIGYFHSINYIAALQHPAPLAIDLSPITGADATIRELAPNIA